MAVSQIPARPGTGGPSRRAADLRAVPAVSVGAEQGKVLAGRPRRRSVLIVLASLLMASVVVFGLVLVNIALAQSSFELGDLQKKVAQEGERSRRLRYEVARAESPERVASTAAELGLVSPESEHHLQGPAVLVSSETEARAGSAGYELSMARP
jgi:cell division protein FtsL